MDKEKPLNETKGTQTANDQGVVSSNLLELRDQHIREAQGDMKSARAVELDSEYFAFLCDMSVARHYKKAAILTRQIDQQIKQGNK